MCIESFQASLKYNKSYDKDHKFSNRLDIKIPASRDKTCIKQYCYMSKNKLIWQRRFVCA